jgi:lipopolysaccharide transport system ATP-binding protein
MKCWPWVMPNSKRNVLGKMETVSREGRTILFVSHNIQAVRQLCTTTIFMDNGKVSLVGSTTDAIARYLGNNENNTSEVDLVNYARNGDTQNGRFQLIQYRDQNGQPLKQCDRSREIHVKVMIKLTTDIHEFDLAMAVTHSEGIKVFSETFSDDHAKPDLRMGTYAVSFVIPAKYLKIGSYSIALAALNKGRMIDFVEGLPAPEITDIHANKDIEVHRWGMVRIPIIWMPVETLRA